MKEQRTDLKPFDLARLEEIRELRRGMYRRGGPNKRFWDELETVLKREDHKNDEWQQMENDFVRGEVWSQSIGEFQYKHTVHKFSYLYVETQGLAIDEHGHEEPVNGGKQVKKVKEWYIFPDGKMVFCDKDKMHSLVNDYGKPIYVLSVKVSSNSTR